MPAIDDATFQLLQRAFGEVALRASRLQEWVELDPLLSGMAASFDNFNQSYREISGALNPDPAAKTRLIESWELGQMSSFIPLQSFRDGIQYLNQPLATFGSPAAGAAGNGGAPAAPALSVSGWIDEIEVLGKAIEAALLDWDPKALSQHCKSYNQRLQRCRIDYRKAVGIEVRELSALTIRLRAKMEG